MFDKDRFIADCCAAVAADDSHKAVVELVANAVAEPAALMASLGEPAQGEVQTFYRSDDLTILNVLWAPHMIIMPHNHNTWAVIGVYTGREDNIFWRRLPDDAGASIEAAGARSLGVREAVPLGRDIIHSVANPIGKVTGALHVYGADFFALERSEWEPETLSEQAYDSDKTMRMFEEANALSASG